MPSFVRSVIIGRHGHWILPCPASVSCPGSFHHTTYAELLVRSGFHAPESGCAFACDLNRFCLRDHFPIKDERHVLPDLRISVQCFCHGVDQSAAATHTRPCHYYFRALLIHKGVSPKSGHYTAFLYSTSWNLRIFIATMQKALSLTPVCPTGFFRRAMCTSTSDTQVPLQPRDGAFVPGDADDIHLPGGADCTCSIVAWFWICVRHGAHQEPDQYVCMSVCLSVCLIRSDPV